MISNLVLTRNHTHAFYNFNNFAWFEFPNRGKLFSVSSVALSLKNKPVLALVPVSGKNKPVLSLVLVPVSKKDVVKVPGFNIPSLTFIEKELNDLRVYQNTDLFALKSSILLGLIDKSLDEFTEISKKGYINDTNLANYPVVKDYIELLLSDEAKSKGKEKYSEKEKRILGILGIVSMGEFKLSYKDVKRLYKWVYNIFHLNLFLICETFLKDYSDEKIPDIIADFKVLARSLYLNLDPSIRIKLSKSGISVIQNVYTGFDTEFKSIDFKFNKLLSAQLAVTTKTILKMPLNPDFDSVESIKWINTKLINSIIKDSIKYYRKTKYGLYDDYMIFIIEKLKKKFFNFEKDGFIYFVFNRGLVKQWFKVVESISFKELVLISNSLGMDVLDDEKEWIIIMLNSVFEGLGYSVFVDNVDKPAPVNTSNITEVEKDTSTLKTSELKPAKYTRTFNQSILKEKVSITIIKNNYFISHYTNADLCMLNDFEELKHKLDIVNKSFVTLKNPLLIDGFNVFIRDTILLAPQKKKSLDDLGSLHGFAKVPLTKNQIENMDLLLIEDPVLFKKYALQDALITLIHACHMEDFNLKIGLIGIPITLSNLSYGFIKDYWKRSGYGGYQLSDKYLFGNAAKTLTPKGLFATKDVGVKLNMYIANYKGGRNECFMFGYNSSPSNIFSDLDLISAYTTAMCALGHPLYDKARVLSLKEFNKLSFSDILYSYTVINTEFSFPPLTKYPSIACNVDENTTVSPLNGTAIIAGSEYLVAKEQGCKFKIKEIFRIPFSWVFIDGRRELFNPPFRDYIKDLQRLRREHEKGTFLNSLYKELGNSTYGLTARGIGYKTKFDVKSQEMKRMVGNDLANPIIASWTTAFIRSVIGELLHNTHKLNGLVLSATTDGFVCNLDDLENRIMKEKMLKKPLLKEYRKLRYFLSGDHTALELKNKSSKPGEDFISYTTRGQISSGAGIIATTGFQKGNVSLVRLEEVFKDIIKSDEKSLVYLQSRLRSAKDLFTEGGHVTMVYRDQTYRLNFDHKRLIIENKNDTLLDSKPLNTVYEAEILRYISKLPKSTVYSEYTPSTGTSYKNTKEIIVRNFIKALLNNKLNLDKNYFNNYKEIINFIHGYDPDYKINENNIALLKRRGNFVVIPKSKESDNFSTYVKKTFPLFDYDKFTKA